MNIFTHRGVWDEHSRQSPILRFLEKYQHHIDSIDIRSTPWSKFYSCDAIFHNTRGDVWISGSHIWRKIAALFEPFDRIFHEVIELRVIPEEDGKYVAYTEFLTHFRLKGDKNEVTAPRFFVFIVGAAEDGEGTDGLVIHELSVFWDTGILTRHIEGNKKKLERKG
ncbi:uncharacterized protein LY89DRAFT_684228 [Mollisia scopiformis]|uniref:SnoaL-like domain-containing protein n=1 Tax=Mollisia scopiformis TaxID=149040 RepID=A0A194XDP4_MOLSC|nr:uncharacterized protein LY89DRAFT_684228 [Mollisia scopiformis]KUJ18305.1 hypothetical protein LY89DRAFT_684228 [Mollisia scopiformis]